jgi:hypothetical protein
MTGRGRALAFVALTLAVIGCDDRGNTRIAGINRPPVDVSSGDFNLVAVNDTLLPHKTTNSGTNYTLVSGSFSLHADSTWLFSTVESVSGTNGVFIGTSPANYSGSWRVADSTVTLLPTYGTAKIKGDTIFWRNGPRHSWEDTIRFTLVRK